MLPQPTYAPPHDQIQKLVDYNLSRTQTEQSNPKTQRLSQAFATDTQAGLRLLEDIDRDLIKSLHEFNDKYFQALFDTCLVTIKNGGRIVVGGCGASGRVSMSFEAKWREFWSTPKNQVFKLAHQEKGVHVESAILSVIGGGITAFSRPREGFEDSIPEGRQALKSIKFSKNDLLITLSASGSSQFSAGMVQYAYEQGTKSYYLLNSAYIPSHTQELFDKNQAFNYCVETRPQALTGSTRMQSTTFFKLAIGAILNALISNLMLGSTSKVQDLSLLIKNFEGCISLLDACTLETKTIIDLQLKTLREGKGDITHLCNSKAMIESNQDTSETSPTFNSPPPRENNEEAPNKPHAQFRTYSIDSAEHTVREEATWEKLAGHILNTTEIKDIRRFTLHAATNSWDGFSNRLSGEHNLVMLILQGDIKESELQYVHKLKEQNQDLKIALIALPYTGDSYDRTQSFTSLFDASLVLPLARDASDPLEIGHSTLLKLLLNNISTGSMILAGYAYGNLMSNVRASNIKLQDRVIRIVTVMLKDEGLSVPSRYLMAKELLCLTHERQQDPERDKQPIVKELKKRIVSQQKATA